MADPLKMSASELGEAFENNLIDPVEALEAFFDAIQKNTLTDRIFVAVTKARAVGEAEDARKRRKFNALTWSLDEVPLSWKDLFDIAGYQTTIGSDLLKGWIRESDWAILKLASINGVIT